MLPTSRVLSVLLMGVGSTLLIVGLLVPRVIDGEGRLPLDIGELTWTLRDEKAKSMVVADAQRPVVETPVTRQTHVTLEEPSSDEVVTVRVGTTQLREGRQEEADRLISAQVWSYGVDRLAGRGIGSAVLSQQLASPTEEVAAPGVWWKFPSPLKEQDYEVFDETLRGTRPASFEGVEEREGRDVYHFRQVIEPTNVAQLYRGTFSTVDFLGAEEGGRGFLFHSATRDYYVDRASGLVVDLREKIDDYYGTADGVKREQVLAFEGALDPQQSADLLIAAHRMADRPRVGVWSWAGIGFGVVFVFVGLVGAFRPGRR